MTQTLISQEKRSVIMKSIRSSNTKPELRVRKILHSLGYRYRLHAKGLPGSPDIVFYSRKKVIFVHGCFWHQHPDDNCRSSIKPRTNTEYWDSKLRRNIERDLQNQNDLVSLGWDYLILWECEIDDIEPLVHKIIFFLGPTKEGVRNLCKRQC